MNEQRSCGKCRFWVNANSHNPVFGGECHRYAPQPSKGLFEQEVLAHLSLISWHLAGDDKNWSNKWEEALAYRGCWPGTDEDDWCGEFALPLEG